MKGLLVAALTLGCACVEPERQPPPPTRAMETTLPVFSPPAGFTRLRIGLVPVLEPETMRVSHQNLAAYLSRVLSVPVEVVVPERYAEALAQLERGDFDLVSLPPLAYVEASRRMKLNCLVQTIADGSATAAGYLFVRDDSPRRTLEDLKGATFAFVDPMSASGSLMAEKLFKDHGFDLQRDLGRVEYLGNHEAVLKAVMSGKVEVGATYQGAFSSHWRASGEDPLALRVVAKTQRSPRDILCLRDEVPKEVGHVITSALLALSSRDRVAREVLRPLHLNGYQPARPESYDGVRAAAAELRP